MLMDVNDLEKGSEVLAKLQAQLHGILKYSRTVICGRHPAIIQKRTLLVRRPVLTGRLGSPREFRSTAASVFVSALDDTAKMATYSELFKSAQALHGFQT
jgi:hypothetical protein